MSADEALRRRLDRIEDAARRAIELLGRGKVPPLAVAGMLWLALNKDAEMAAASVETAKAAIADER